MAEPRTYTVSLRLGGKARLPYSYFRVRSADAPHDGVTTIEVVPGVVNADYIAGQLVGIEVLGECSAVEIPDLLPAAC